MPIKRGEVQVVPRHGVMQKLAIVDHNRRNHHMALKEGKMETSAKRLIVMLLLPLAACNKGGSSEVVIGPPDQQQEIEALQGKVADLQKQVADLVEKDKLLVTMIPAASNQDPILNIIEDARDRERDRRLEEIERRTGSGL